MRIKAFDPVYFKNKVSIFGVYTAAHDFAKCAAFTNQLGALVCNHFPADYSGIFVANRAARTAFYQHAFATGLEDCKAMVADSKEKDLDAVNDAFSNLFPFAKLHVDHPAGKNSLNVLLSCPMGFDNLMLAANGDYLICHKVSGQMPIGNCASGLDAEKLITLYQTYNAAVNNPDCKQCWNVHFCDICAASRMEGDHFVNPNTEECNLLRLQTAYAFSCFSHLSLEHPELLEKIFAFRNDPRKYIGVIDFHEF
jgi:radical SAM protein with 4Fe4S-binding SPASM domain